MLWTETDSGSWQRQELILSRWELAAAPSVLPCLLYTSFYSITQKDTKMMYVQDSNCSMENSDFCDLSMDEIAYIQTNARRLFAQ